MTMTTNPTDAERDADDAAYCAAYVDAVHLGPSSAIDYLRTMVAECDAQEREHTSSAHAAGHRSDAMAAAASWGYVTYWRGRRDAYNDALRVLDIAADSAQGRADRARDDRRAALVLGGRS